MSAWCNRGLSLHDISSVELVVRAEGTKEGSHCLQQNYSMSGGTFQVASVPGISGRAAVGGGEKIGTTENFPEHWVLSRESHILP